MGLREQAMTHRNEASVDRPASAADNARAPDKAPVDVIPEPVHAMSPGRRISGKRSVDEATTVGTATGESGEAAGSCTAAAMIEPSPGRRITGKRPADDMSASPRHTGSRDPPAVGSQPPRESPLSKLLRKG